jgi:hypothetical protein
VKPEIAVDADSGMLEWPGVADALRELNARFSVWLLTARGDHRFAELQSRLTKYGVFPGTHYIGVTNVFRESFVFLLSPRARSACSTLDMLQTSGI